MDWTQLISLAGYTTAICYFFYKLNEKSIEKNEAHWREMFMYMSGRIDRSKETDTKTDNLKVQ
jgi:hypothetical protein